MINDYFEWLVSLVNGWDYSRLLSLLHSIEFTYTNPLDENRYRDGLELKSRYLYENGYDHSYINLLGTKCSVLEMMVALAVRCETTIMSDYTYGDRTSLWFNCMLDGMRLCNSTDTMFDEDYCRRRIDIMLNRLYDEYGDGGLFYVRFPDYDMRRVEIWCQMNWYLNENY